MKTPNLEAFLRKHRRTCTYYGFSLNTHPDFPDWSISKTYISLCNKHEDDREDKYGFHFDGYLEFSTVGEIKKVCPSCWPFQKAENAETT